MLKIISAEQIRQADEYTISHEPVTSIDLMERAAAKCVDWIINADFSSPFKIFCGTGNNGGDGLAIARMLYLKGKQVEVYIIEANGNYSADCKINLDRYQQLKSSAFHLIHSENDFPLLSHQEIIIDALFGTGLNRKTEGIFAALIHHINQHARGVLSIDMPSGLFADVPNDKEQAIIKATFTLTFQLPKLVFLFPENGIYTGSVHVLDIGLSKDFIDKTVTKNFFLEEQDINQLRKKRFAVTHKGNYGHALIIAGSYGKIGAAVLSAKACIRTGAGLVTALIPSCGYRILQTAVPEVMVITSESEKFISKLPDIAKYNSIAIGPGIGTDLETANVIKMLIQNCSVPIVFDADAINLLSENKTWLAFIPKGSIFTPHPGEFERMVGKWTDGFERQQLQLEFSKKYSCYVVLKDHYTCISSPDGICYFNSTGNPGMATAGSGDVLTGMITGLLAQGYSPRNATIIGVYIHGWAGDSAALEKSMESMIASDIIENIGNAFLSFDIQ